MFENLPQSNDITLAGVKIQHVSKRKVTHALLSPRDGIYLDKPTKPHKYATICISDGTIEIVIELSITSLDVKNGTGNFLKDLIDLTKKDNK